MHAILLIPQNKANLKNSRKNHQSLLLMAVAQFDINSKAYQQEKIPIQNQKNAIDAMNEITRNQLQWQQLCMHY